MVYLKFTFSGNYTPEAAEHLGRKILEKLSQPHLNLPAVPVLTGSCAGSIIIFAVLPLSLLVVPYIGCHIGLITRPERHLFWAAGLGAVTFSIAGAAIGPVGAIVGGIVGAAVGTFGYYH